MCLGFCTCQCWRQQRHDDAKTSISCTHDQRTGKTVQSGEAKARKDGLQASATLHGHNKWVFQFVLPCYLKARPKVYYNE